MIIKPNYEDIINPLEPTSTGTERRCIFGKFVYDLMNRRVSMDFKVEYGKTVTTVVNEGMEDEEILTEWQVINIPNQGITSYPEPFVADDSTVVDMEGHIVKYPNEDATVDLDEPDKQYIGQFGFFYMMSKGEPIVLELMLKQFILNTIEDGRFANF